MKKYILYGAGNFGKLISEWVPSQIAFFIDGDSKKWGTYVNKIPVFSIQEKSDDILKYTVIIATKEEYVSDILAVLKEYNVTDYITFKQFESSLIKERMGKSCDNLATYRRAVDWIYSNSVKDMGIINNTSQPYPYPEVTGYYIPSLIYWGHRDLALTYTKWLCEIQKEDGAFYGTKNDAPYIFDTAQILKGLLAVRKVFPEVKENIIRACDWMLEYMDDDGRLRACDDSVWGNGKTLSELIHLYCLSPLVEAGRIYNVKRYIEKANRCVDYYLKKYASEINSFTLMSHFHAYIIEGLLDMDRRDEAIKALEIVNELSDSYGFVPAYKDVHWVCSTGLMQFAVIWFRLGDVDRGERALQYACQLQNPSGGWFGCYPTDYSDDEKLTYLPTAEISWANKYFLDAVRYRGEAIFETRGDYFVDRVDKASQLYQIVEEVIEKSKKEKEHIVVGDIGCGRGSYLKNLIEDFPEEQFVGVDISEHVMSYINSDKVETTIGSLTSVPFEDKYFDVCLACESLEHAVDIESAINELGRVTKSGGYIVVIDKHSRTMGDYVIEEWEQYFDIEKLRGLMETQCVDVEVKSEIGHAENMKDMTAWIGKVK